MTVPSDVSLNFKKIIEGFGFGLLSPCVASFASLLFDFDLNYKPESVLAYMVVFGAISVFLSWWFALDIVSDISKRAGLLFFLLLWGIFVYFFPGVSNSPLTVLLMGLIGLISWTSKETRTQKAAW